jgi:hypothetical protein
MTDILRFCVRYRFIQDIGLIMVERICAFCEAQLTHGKGGSRAREHVFKKSWIQALGHQEKQIHLDHFRKEKLVKSTSRPAIHFLAGDVCDGCNNGWMNDVDKAVEPYILSLAMGRMKIHELNQEASLAIARWLMKTAATFELADSKDRRHISREMLLSIPNQNFIPKGFGAFAYQFDEPQRELGACIIDGMLSLDAGVNKVYVEPERLKFGIQYDNIMLGCCFVNYPDPLFLSLPGMHVPIYANQANFLFAEELWQILAKVWPRAPFKEIFLNVFLASMTFFSEEAATGVTESYEHFLAAYKGAGGSTQ